MRLLVVADRPGWAFARISENLVSQGKGQGIDIHVHFLKGNQRRLAEVCGEFSHVFFLHWSLLLEVKKTLRWRFRGRRFGHCRLGVPSFVDPERTLVGIHAHDDWDDHRSRPDQLVVPPPNLVKTLGRFRAVNAVSNRLFQLFRQAGLGNLSYTPNGVDVDIFRSTRQLGGQGKLVVGCTATPKRDWNKGLTEFLKPLAQLPFVDLRLAILDKTNLVPYEHMPQYYNELDVYVCASASEGFSLSVLEASACGRPVISTRVGGSEDLITDGVNGFLVDRKREAITEKLRLLHQDQDLLVRMGRKNREIVEGDWSWRKRIGDWLDFIVKATG